jgi:hypothetical protein
MFCCLATRRTHSAVEPLVIYKGLQPVDCCSLEFSYEQNFLICKISFDIKLRFSHRNYDINRAILFLSLIICDCSCLLSCFLCPSVQIPIFFCFFYPCCSHLEHRVSVKRFVSLQCLNVRLSVGIFGQGIGPSKAPT